MGTRDRHAILFGRIALALTLAWSAGCSGSLDEGPVPFSEHDPLEAGPGGIRVLTVSQYAASVRAALELPDDAPVPRVGNWTSSMSAAHSPAGVIVEYEAAAHEVTASVFGDASARTRLLGGCEPTRAAGDACTRTVIERVGRHAFRRRLGPEEIRRWTELATSLGATLEDPMLALQYAIAGLLQSPSFLYRVELPEPSIGTDGSSGLYGSDALATRLAYFLWDAPPDDALLDAAERGDLLDPSLYDAQLDRMLADARTEDGLDSFVYDLFSVQNLGEPCRGDDCPPVDPTARVNPAYAPQLVATASTALSEGGFQEMLLTRSPFVDVASAAHYGLDPADFGPALERVTLPASSGRIGALLTPGHLVRTSSDGHPSVVRRGLFVLRDLLCESIGAPPSAADAVLPTDDPDMPRSARQRSQAHARPGCSSCHGRIDPIGLGLENYDQFGRWQSMEVGLPIDASGELDGEQFVDAQGLVEVIADSPAYEPCMTTHLYARATGEPVSPRAAEIREMTTAGGGDVRATLRAIARSGAFRNSWGETP
jgi:hypothetical protein